MILRRLLNILMICIGSIKNIDKYDPDKENKVLIVFDDMIADMINNKELNSIEQNYSLEVEN